ncbi:MAG: Uncharacterised protein [Cellulomonadaceae bacterium TMED98]|nr:MAG: Uncharacterised protein [Cellulomonadaceae bacterium TMED98]
MIGSLPLIAVGQQHDKARALIPLLFGRGNELVDDRLRTVHKIAKLRFPQHKRIGSLDGEAVFEGESGVFAEERVVNPQSCLVV